MQVANLTSKDSVSMTRITRYALLSELRESD